MKASEETIKKGKASESTGWYYKMKTAGETTVNAECAVTRRCTSCHVDVDVDSFENR
jgi:hypothetical protein